MSHDPQVPADVQVGIPCSLYRGGTSRGVLMLGSELPYPRDVVERMLRRIFGSPDARQIDGVGGGSSQTSKVVIVEPSGTPDADVRMTFAQVSVDTATVDWGGTCGNMTAAVGPFAIEMGLVAPVEPVTVVRILSVNTGKRISASVPVRDGQVVTEGDYQIPGAPGQGARLVLQWFEPGGSVTGRVLPTGRPRDTVRLSDGRSVEISIVDAANPVAFCDARELGLRGTELPGDIERRPDVLAALEEIRAIAAEMLAIVPSRALATRQSPGLPKVAMVAPPAGYRTSTGALVGAETVDVQARLMSMQAPHRSYSVSGGICTAVAAAIEGTVVHACRRAAISREEPFQIAQPYGLMEILVDMGDDSSGFPHVRSATVARTARRIMSGVAYVPASMLPGAPAPDRVVLAGFPGGSRPGSDD